MFRGHFKLRSGIDICYREQGKRIIFTFCHPGAPRLSVKVVALLEGDCHIAVHTGNFAFMGEAESLAGVMILSAAQQFSMTLKHRFQPCFLSDPFNVVEYPDSEEENACLASWETASRAIDEEMRVKMNRRVTERLLRWKKQGRPVQTSEQMLGLPAQPKPLCGVIEKEVYNPDARDWLVAQVHQLRDWGQCWKNLAKAFLKDADI